MITIYTAYVGSKLHGTMGEDSDLDVRHVFIRDLKEQVAPLTHLKPTHEIKGQHKDDEVAYELSHFARMLLKNNPTAHEIAWSHHSSGTDEPTIKTLAWCALDTTQYTKNVMGMMRNLIEKPNAKAQYHAARLYLHLKRYLQDGVLAYDTHEYGESERQWLLDIKYEGLAIPSDFDFFALEDTLPNCFRHTSDPMRVQNLVFNTYMEAE